MNVIVNNIKFFDLELKTDLLDLDTIQEIVALNSYNKTKREPSTPQRHALVNYFEQTYGIVIPKNYSQKKIIETAEELLIELQKEREAKEAETKIISPFDILRGDKTIIEYNPTNPNGFMEENAYELDKIRQKADAEFSKGLLPRGTRDSIRQNAIDSNKEQTQVRTQINVNATPIEMQHPTCLGSYYDIVLPRGFTPKFQLHAKTLDGRPCATVSYVLLDEIIKLGALWKLNVMRTRYKDDLLTLIYWIQKNGEVIVRETLDDNYIILR